MGGWGRPSVTSPYQNTKPEALPMKAFTRIAIPALIVGLAPWTPGAASAQSTRPLSPGDSVLVTWTVPGPSAYSLYSFGAYTERATLELVSIRAGRLTGLRVRGRGRQNGLVIVDTGHIRSVQRRIGTKPTVAPAMVYGSAAGFVAGFLGGAWNSSMTSTVNGSSDAVDAGLRSGVLIGAPLGAAIAWLASRSRGIYENVAVVGLRPTVAVTPGGGGGFSIAVAGLGGPGPKTSR
jgi:hypothetical protein